MSQGQGRFKLQEDGKLGSALEMMRELKLPSEIEGEKVLVRSQAAYDTGSISRSWWKMGFLYLTGTRLIFTQGGNKLFEIPIDLLSGLEIVNRNWIPGKVVQQLRLIKVLERRKTTFYLSVKDPEKWVIAIEKTKKEGLDEFRG